MDTSAGIGNQPAIRSDIITLADGKEYKLAPLTLNRLCEIEDSLGSPMEEALKTSQLKTLRAILYVRIKPNYPALTIEQVGDLITLKTIGGLKDLLNED